MRSASSYYDSVTSDFGSLRTTCEGTHKERGQVGGVGPFGEEFRKGVVTSVIFTKCIFYIIVVNDKLQEIEVQIFTE